jgi:hypothetical protein
VALWWDFFLFFFLTSGTIGGTVVGLFSIFLFAIRGWWVWVRLGGKKTGS